jgi:putative methionine-R-sulfoxide reductase with GAF domain
LAKQFGVKDDALAGLRDPGSHPFPPDQRAALLFADAMTDGPGRVPDPVYEELRRHFSEPQTVEIASVVGLFNYFNRFNNALHVAITLMDPDVLVRRVEEAAAAAVPVPDLCDRVVDILHQGRRYVGVGIYQREGDRLERRAHRGPAPPRHSFRLGEGNVGTTGQIGVTKVVDSELVVPIRAPGGVVGVIAVESDRDAAFDDEERSLVERVAAALASRMA